MSGSEEAKTLLVDARIVNTIRNLRMSSASKKSTPELSESRDVKKDQSNTRQKSANLDVEESKIQKELATNSSEEEKNYGSSNPSASFKINSMKSSSNNVRISIDSLHTPTIIGDKAKPKKETMKMLNFSEKNEYQRKLTNQPAIDKYKIQCLQLLREDESLKSSLEVLKISDLSRFIEDYLFNDLFFQYKLEVFLLQKNGNTKNQKLSFFKVEMGKVLEFKMLDILLLKKIESVNSKIDSQIKAIELFDLN